MLSNHAKEIKDNNISIGQVHKLISTLNKKEKYVLHYRDLQLYLDLGLKLKKSTSCSMIPSIRLVETIY